MFVQTRTANRRRLGRRRPLLAVGEVEVLRAAARAAEDAGDFAGALRLVSGLPPTEPVERWKAQLSEAALIRSDERDRLARWLLQPAVRWAQERPEGGLLLAHARLLLEVMGVRAPERQERAVALAARDPAVLDAGLFDGALFARYLQSVPRLLERAGPVADWAACPPSVWRLEARTAGAVTLHDLCADHSTSSLPWAGCEQAPIGGLICGRVVPAGDGRVMFALPPETIDQRCASRLVRDRHRGTDPRERLRAVAHCRRRRALTGCAP